MSTRETPDPKWIAACGLDCEACEIRRLPLDEDAADTCIAWYREMGWLTENDGVREALERKMYCHGCKGDRSVHWSVDEDGMCWILQCCVDEKQLGFCSDCDEFPCSRLVDWSTRDESYAKAFERLEAMQRRGT
jgi:hypothetical protein